MNLLDGYGIGKSSILVDKEGWDGITLTEDYGLGDICA